MLVYEFEIEFESISFLGKCEEVYWELKGWEICVQMALQEHICYPVLYPHSHLDPANLSVAVIPVANQFMMYSSLPESSWSSSSLFSSSQSSQLL